MIVTYTLLLLLKHGHHIFIRTVFTNSVGGGHSSVIAGSSSSQHDVASEILSIGPIQLDDLRQTDLVTPITITAASSSATGQQILTTVTSASSG